MFKKFFKTRLDVFSLITIMIFMVIIFRLADIQIVQGEYYKKKSETIRTRNIPVVAPRGNIVDMYGRILAGNKLSYSVNILKADVDKKTLNQIALAVTNIIEKNGDVYKDEIPILINPLRFSFDDDELKWKAKYNIPPTASAREAFNKLKTDYATRLSEDYGLDAEASDEEVYDALKESGVELPFGTKEFEFKYRSDEANWKAKYKFDPNITAAEAFNKLLEKYGVDRKQYNDSDAKKILAVKYLVGQNIYKQYEPVEIAVDIKEQTRAQIEENKIFLPGVEIMEKPIRNYYNNQLACHILGYMGKIGDELDKLLAKGYTAQDVIGKNGIEYSAEQYLKGTNGTKQIEVDVNGTLINTINEEEPTPGNTVFLTLDSKLQKVAEDSLRDTMANIRAGDKTKGWDPMPNATSGAVVALDVNTGRILAMASEPGYDPNIFAAGISSKDWQALQPKTSNIYEPKPLINNTIAATLPPGSTMKMVAGIAGLDNGNISPTEIILDKGPYTVVPGVSPSCLIWKTQHRTHGPQNIVLALKNSCNYFFFEVGRRIGGDMFEKYAMDLGFGQKTGIDLPYESEGKVEGPQHKLARYERYLKYYLSNTLKISDEKLIKEITGYIYNNPGRSTVMKRLSDLQKSGIIPEGRNANNKIWNYIRESRWSPGDVLNAAIGQGMNNVTPLQLTNYVATIVNGGTRYKPYIIDKVVSYDGKIVKENKPEIQKKMNYNPENIEWLKRGMYAVNNEAGGTARSSFVGSKTITGGKTGTAQAGGNYDAHAWYVAFAPYDKPQIAIAVLIFQGGHGNYAAPVARAIIDQYLTPEATLDLVPLDNQITQ